jgi:pyrimidine-nucleoside phosphorylase
MKSFTVYELIDKKKKGKKLTKDEIKWLIDSLMNKTLPDYQMTAMLMAMFIQGMDEEETANLTDAMLYSGKTLNFNNPKVIDKHSTGGIGDKTSFILAPIAAACGVKVPMMAGRSLGFTGGTIDKIESVKGFKTTLTLEQFKEHLNKYGLVLIGQTQEIAPADKIIYGLRDVTATIDSIPLITASIMSKKLAEGANGIVMDVKCGNGAFMRDLKGATALGQSIFKTAKRFKKKAVVVVSDMNQPLGNLIGNSLEIIESVETLKGKGPEDLTELSLILAAHMVVLAGEAKDFKQAYAKCKKSIENGSALKKFRELIIKQGGDDSFINDYSKLPSAKVSTVVTADHAGYVKSFQTDLLGFLLIELGGGRKLKTDQIDFGVGFTLHKKVGDKVEKGDSLITIHHHENQIEKADEIVERLIKEVIKLSKSKIKKPKLVLKTITGKGK